MAKTKLKLKAKPKAIAIAKGRIISSGKNKPASKIIRPPVPRKKGTKSGPIEKQAFKKCPKCKQEKGFHLLLIPQDGQREGRFVVHFKCPKCNGRFQFGLISDKV